MTDSDQRGLDDKRIAEAPSTAELIGAMDWLRAGAPAAHKDYKHPERHVKVLLQLLYLLPVLMPKYCYGTPEYAESMRTGK